MKRCPKCSHVYEDETLNFCLDDGEWLIAHDGDTEPATAILHETAPPGEAATRAQIHMAEQTTESPSGTTDVPNAKSFDKRLLLAPVALAAVVLGGFFGYLYFNSPGSGSINSIAVLPFENRSANADTDYLSDGLSDSLIYRLTQLPNLKVSPTSSVIRYKGKHADVAEIAKELEVDAVMSGKLAQRGDDLTISVELVDTRTKMLIWAEQYDRKLSDLLATQREIATAITQKLQLKLAGDEKGITKKYTNSSEAYQLYLKGQYQFARRTKEGVSNAIDSYQEAIDLDPNFALAYARMAEAYNQMPNYPYAAPRVAFPKAKAAAEKAIAIDPTLSEAHAAVGNTLTSYDWNWAEAEKSFKRALELDPNSAVAHYRYATEYLISVGRTREAVAEVEKALEIEPLASNMIANLGRVYLHDGQRDRALEQARKAYEGDPDFVVGRLLYGTTLIAVGRYADAITLSEKELQNDPNNQHMLLVAGHGYAHTGRRGDADKVIQRFKEMSKTQYVVPSFVATVYAAMGEKEKAFAELENAIEMRDSWFKWAKVEPLFDTLRDDPRFIGLLRRMNLPE